MGLYRDRSARELLQHASRPSDSLSFEKRKVSVREGNEIVQRLLERGREVRERQESVRQLYREREDKECSFRPNTGRVPEGTAVDFDAFLRTQQEHAERREAHLEALRVERARQELEQQLLF